MSKEEKVKEASGSDPQDLYGFVGLRHESFIEEVKLIEGFKVMMTVAGWNIYYDKNWHDNIDHGKNNALFINLIEKFHPHIQKNNSRHLS